MLNGRPINPQSIALAEHKPAAKPVIVVSKPTKTVDTTQVRDNIANDPTRQAALDLLKKVVEEHGGVAVVAAKPVRGMIAKPVSTATVNNVATPTGTVTPAGPKEHAATDDAATLRAQLKVALDENIQSKRVIVSLNYDIAALKEQLAVVSAERDEATAQFLAADNSDRAEELEGMVSDLQ